MTILTNMHTNISAKKSANIIFNKINTLSEEEILAVVNRLAVAFEITEELALEAIYFLLLRGAANKNAPDNMKVTQMVRKLQLEKTTLCTNMNS